MINSFSIGILNIRFYSLCILFGIVLAYIIIMKESKRQKISTDLMFNIMFYGIILGILGARIYYVLFNFDYYMNHLDEIIKIWYGGLAIHGGIIAGTIVVYFFSKKKKINFFKLSDIILPGVIIAQSFGRWGNFFNQEAYGMLVSKDVLHKLLVPSFVIDGMYINGSYYLPTFYFESIICILGFIIMMIIRKKCSKTGVITSFYLIWYGLFRFIIEYFRTDSLMLFNIKVAMLVSVLMILLGTILLVRSLRSKE